MLGGCSLRIRKVINNNVVSCVDSDGQELVVMGRGLGFGAKPGRTLDASAVEKIFRMDSPEQTRRLKDVFSQLPPEVLDLCTRIIDYAKTAIRRELNESIYLTLSDHILFALNLSSQGMSLPNPLLTEVRVFYPAEFAVGKYALERIQAEMGKSLGEGEAASIALHLVNAEYSGSMNATMHATQVLHPMVEILENWPELKLNRQHLFYDELIVHIKFMALQAFSQAEREWVDAGRINGLVQDFPQEFACAKAITDYLSRQSDTAVPAQEQAYLALCIHRACIS